MTNNEKERLKSVVIDWANGYLAEYSRHIYSTNPMIKYNKKSDVTLADVKILDSIIDRQPSEEASEWINSIDDCIGKVDWFYKKKCDKALLALDAIRKALGIEVEEGLDGS